ncbi:hypothetical protein PRK78_004848 [Emydomyces testavorans]|uniref:Uncharacterized protein n=1 Tax=Emydomyces testavorans TaxID=2070801 RepID=A0AAF0DKN0_9EURO|nr:hypothetical protein PRK78_004848 [Emydomyces testavorans]
MEMSKGQLKITAARPGVVNFELDIRKEHTGDLLRWLHEAFLLQVFQQTLMIKLERSGADMSSQICGPCFQRSEKHRK